MSNFYKNFKMKIFNAGPLILLYFLSISEVDTQFSNLFEILSFNLQWIIIYYWSLKRSIVLGTGHVFVAGIFNDVVVGLPLGISALTYLTVVFVASYIKNVTINNSIFTDWFTFVLAVFFANITFLVLMYNFTDFSFTYLEIFYHSFFTVLFYPFFWLLFNFYKMLLGVNQDD